MQLREIANHSNAHDDRRPDAPGLRRWNPLCARDVPLRQGVPTDASLFAIVPHYRLPEAHVCCAATWPYREAGVPWKATFPEMGEGRPSECSRSWLAATRGTARMAGAAVDSKRAA